MQLSRDHNEEENTILPTASIVEINKFLRRNPRAVEDQGEELEELLSAFLVANENPAQSPNLALAGADDMSCLVYLVSNARVLCHNVSFD